MSQRNPGRLRIRLADLLAAKSLIVDPYDLWTQEGGYRSRHWDLARWGTDHATWRDGIAPDGTRWTMEVQLSSWSTMTACVRRGIDVGKEDEFGRWDQVAVEAS